MASPVTRYAVTTFAQRACPRSLRQVAARALHQAAHMKKENKKKLALSSLTVKDLSHAAGAATNDGPLRSVLNQTGQSCSCDVTYCNCGNSARSACDSSVV